MQAGCDILSLSLIVMSYRSESSSLTISGLCKSVRLVVSGSESKHYHHEQKAVINIPAFSGVSEIINEAFPGYCLPLCS